MKFERLDVFMCCAVMHQKATEAIFEVNRGWLSLMGLIPPKCPLIRIISSAQSCYQGSWRGYLARGVFGRSRDSSNERDDVAWPCTLEKMATNVSASFDSLLNISNPDIQVSLGEMICTSVALDTSLFFKPSTFT